MLKDKGIHSNKNKLEFSQPSEKLTKFVWDKIDIYFKEMARKARYDFKFNHSTNVTSLWFKGWCSSDFDILLIIYLQEIILLLS